MADADLKRQPAGFVLLAIILVMASHAIPAWIFAIAKHFDWQLIDSLGPANFEALVFLCFSILLISNDPLSYGFRLGDEIGRKWPAVLVLCLVPIILTAVVYPLLPSKPFSGGPAATWLISPLAQDLFFAGFLYRWFAIHFPGRIISRFPANRCIILTAACFSAWHLPNALHGIGAFIWFQIAYTFLGACFVGIVRQWTGSFIYITFVHMSVNFIAVHF
ncbi:MAG: CPBP family intramembrane glutamic endopeptidase [Planctomycetota bacterium]